MRMRPSLLALALTAALTACSHTPILEVPSARTLHGKAFGGQQPVTASTIQLYAINTAADGGPATALLASTVTTSDGTGQLNANANTANANNTLPAGTFNITFTCPTPDVLVYITASGGNPGLAGTVNNAALQLLAALGSCSNLLANVPSVSINEVTTVGAIAALYPYTTAFDHIGSTPAHAQALAAAFNAANEYTNFQTGQAPGPALPATYLASTPDLNALANVLATCVNSNGSTAGGSPCNTLFGYATPPSSTTSPADTVGAMLNIRLNPTLNLSNIFYLPTGTSPFTPVNATPPLDFTLPIYKQLGIPAFSPAAGSYSTAQSVSITDSDPGATLHYTTDGSIPTPSSAVYTAPILVTAPETVNALAIDGRLSATASAAYSGALAITNRVGLSSVSAPAGSTTPVTLTATQSGSAGTATGSIVTFGVTGAATGSFSPATCTIVNGTCSVSYLPDGILAPGTYTNSLTSAFTAAGPYAAASATSTLTLTNAPSSSGTTFSVLASFTGTSGTAPGQYPNRANLIQGSDGNFYGTTCNGGASGAGAVFKINADGSKFTLLHSFSFANNDGSTPINGLIQGSDGNFYGITLDGGAGYGTIFKINADGSSYTQIHSFNARSVYPPNSPIPPPFLDGQSPSGLVQGSDGNFYGTTLVGGRPGYGTVFKINADGSSYTQLHAFSPAATDGAIPNYGSLIQGSDGDFYGTTGSGGANNAGTIYKINASGSSFTLLHSFPYNPITGSEGSSAGLVQGSDGAFYGTTDVAGVNSKGSIFKINASGSSFALLHSFSGTPIDGSNLCQGLVLGSDGNFYGTTYLGGVNDDGTIFKMNPSGSSFTVLHSFSTASTDGAHPDNGLVQGGDGSFYGATDEGGAENDGTVFKLTSAAPLAAPITLTVPAAVTHATTFTLSYAVANAFSTTLQTCFATNYLQGTNTAGDTTGWTGPITGSPTVQNKPLTAPALAGTYTYALTCGGQQSGFATLNVQ